MTRLQDVAPSDLIASSRQNDINDYIESADEPINTQAVYIDSTLVIGSNRTIQNILNATITNALSNGTDETSINEIKECINTVSNYSPDWDAATTLVENHSDTWISYENNSGGWENTRLAVVNNSSEWETVYSTVLNNSAGWGGSIILTVQNNSPGWESTESTVNNNSSNWEDAVDKRVDTWNAPLNFSANTASLLYASPLSLNSSNQIYIATDAIKDTHIDWGSGANQVDVSDLPIQILGSPTYTTQKDFNKLFGSTGRATGGEVTDGGSETVNVAAGTGFIKATDSNTADLLSFDWSATTGIAVATNTVVYIGVRYNSGSPEIFSTSDEYGFDLDTSFPLAKVTNEAGTLHILNNPWWVTDGTTNIIERIQALGHIVRDTHFGGLVLGVSGTRNITVSAGKLWSRLNEFEVTALDTSSSGTFEYYWYNGVAGTWNSSDATQYSVLQYNDITLATLQNINNNWYANIWVYAEADDNTIALLYPQAQYATSAGAEAEAPPTTIPLHISENAILLGRILIKQNTNTPVEVQSAFDTLFNPAQAADHGNLSGLSDDDHAQYLRTDGTRSLTGDWTIGGYALTNTIANGANKVALTLTNNDVTNNPNTLVITDTSTANTILITKTGATGQILRMVGATGSASYMQSMVVDTYGLNFNKTGTGVGTIINMADAGTGSMLIANKNNVLSTASLFDLTNTSNGKILNLTNNGDVYSIFIDHNAGTGYNAAIYADTTGSTGRSFYFTSSTARAITNPFLHIYDSSATIATDCASLKIECTNVNKTSSCLDIINTGSGKAIYIAQNTSITSPSTYRGVIDMDINANNTMGLYMQMNGVIDSDYHSAIYIYNPTNSTAGTLRAMICLQEGGASSSLRGIEYYNNQANGATGIQISHTSATSTGAGISISNAGTGYGLYINKTGTSGYGLYVVNSGVNATPVGYILGSTTTGPVLMIHQGASGGLNNSDNGVLYLLDQGTTSSRAPTLNVRTNTVHTGTAALWQIVESSSSSCIGFYSDYRGSNYAHYINQQGVNNALRVYSNVGSTSSAALVEFIVDNTGFDQPLLKLTNDGTGNGLMISQNGNGAGVVVNTSTTTGYCDFTFAGTRGVTTPGIRFYDNSASLSGDYKSVVLIQTNNASNTTDSMWIRRNSDGNAGYCLQLFIDNAGNTTGAMKITNAGSGASISAGGSIIAVTTLNMSGQLTSTLADGTAPFVITSTTPVTNLTSNSVFCTASHGTDHTATGIKISLVANENQAFGDVCYINSDGQAQLVDASAIATSSGLVMCIDANISADASGNYLLYGVARDDTWNWTVGGLIYISITGTTENTLTQTAPSGTDEVIQIIGVATHADRMIFMPNLVQVEHI